MDDVVKKLERFEELLLFINSEDFIAEADPMGYVEEWQEYFDLRREIQNALGVVGFLNVPDIQQIY